MPKFLVDESTGKKLFDLLVRQKFDVKYAGFELKGAIDDEILKFSEKEKRILITDDSDFGELIFRLGRPAFGVIFLRTKTIYHNERFLLLKNLFKKIKKLERKFIVITEETIRTREIK